MNTDKKQKTLVFAIAFVLIVVAIVLTFINFNKNSSKKITEEVKETLKLKKEQIIYVQNTKKCDSCSKIKKYLDNEQINYTLYNVNNYSKSDYEKFLQEMNINPSDFNYPAVILIKDGIMYANIINVNDTKVVEQFVKDYDLKKIK